MNRKCLQIAQMALKRNVSDKNVVYGHNIINKWLTTNKNLKKKIS